MKHVNGTTATAIAVAGLLTAGVAGLAAGQGGGLTEPTSMQLRSTGVIAEAKGGQIVEGAADADGSAVGKIYWDCTNAEDVAWFCDAVIALDDAAASGAGTIVVQGLFDGFNGESLAVTGGTGAYANARGSATLSLKDDAFTWDLDLIP
jgi:hypothetical protein